MRSAEVRIAGVMIGAIAALLGATYWHAAHALARPLAVGWGYGALIVLGGAACAALAYVGLRREWGGRNRRLVEQVQSILHTSAAAPAEGEYQALIAPLRGHMEQLRGKVEQLQLQKKNLEIQLGLAEAQRRQIHAMIHGISDAVLISDKFDELLMANPAAGEMFRFQVEASIRKPLLGLIGEGELAAEIAEVRQNHRRANRRTLELELTLGGEVRNFTVSLTCLVEESGELGGVVTVLHDITREMEVSRMKTEFVSHVSHELRTPLSSIKAYAELLVDGEATDEKTRQEFYHVIQGEADRLSRLIDNILNISRIESGMMRINKKAISVSGLLKQALEVAMPTAREKNITLVDQVAPVFVQVEADRDMIYQAALNLISNAIKYTPVGGTVRVVLEADELASNVTVKVSDTGVGIPPEAMKHLFTKFFRVEQHKGMAKGSGLGLNLTRQIIEHVHKGRMLVESQPGKGSTFGFVLPIAT